MKKTALTQLIEQWEESKPKGSHGLIWQVFIDEASELLETEREQIEESFGESRKTHPMIGFKHETFEEYYKDTYR